MAEAVDEVRLLDPVEPGERGRGAVGLGDESRIPTVVERMNEIVRIALPVCRRLRHLRQSEGDELVPKVVEADRLVDRRHRPKPRRKLLAQLGKRGVEERGRRSAPGETQKVDDRGDPRAQVARSGVDRCDRSAQIAGIGVAGEEVDDAGRQLPFAHVVVECDDPFARPPEDFPVGTFAHPLGAEEHFTEREMLVVSALAQLVAEDAVYQRERRCVVLGQRLFAQALEAGTGTSIGARENAPPLFAQLREVLALGQQVLLPCLFNQHPVVRAARRGHHASGRNERPDGFGPGLPGCAIQPYAGERGRFGRAPGRAADHVDILERRRAFEAEVGGQLPGRLQQA